MIQADTALRASTDNQAGSQNLRGNYAGFISRFIAEIVDFIAIIVTFSATAYLTTVAFELFQVYTFWAYLASKIPFLASLNVTALRAAVWGIIFFLYFCIYHVFFWTVAGKTPGKALMGVQVVTLTGGRISVTRSIVRMFGYFISAIPFFVGFLWIILDDERRGWHDNLAKTCVIYAWDAHLEERFLTKALTRLAAQTKPAPGQLEAGETEK